jgi:hypothetical protein
VVCIRRAWLELGAMVLPLEDEDLGYWCTELDLGYPEVRDVVDDRPDQDGVDDRTTLMGSRAITATIGTHGAGALTPDEVATMFAPWMLPALRPELHYVLERAPGNPERVITVRAAGYGWPISGSKSREVHLSWVAADPVLRGPDTETSTAWAGSAGVSGRTYPLVFDRTYPTSPDGPASNGVIISHGDVPVKPDLSVYGPITAPMVDFAPNGWAPVARPRIVFVSSFRIDAGRRVDIDTAAKTATDDTGANVLAQIDWGASTWPVLPVAPAYTTLILVGNNTSHISQVVATWSDGYLT